MKKSIILFLAALLIGFTGMAQKSSKTEKTIKKHAEIMQKAMQTGDYKTFGSYFAEDAIFKISNHDVLEGRTAITEAHKPMAEQNIKLTLDVHEVMDFGDHAYEFGKYELHTKEGEQMDHGYYSTLWKKKDGKWKIYRDVISSSVAMN